MVNFIVGFIIVTIIGGAMAYIIREKKKGVKCIGCPDSAQCSGNCSCCSGSCGSNAIHNDHTDTNE